MTFVLQVNDHILYGRNHIEVVTILKELPRHVRIVCARTLSSSVDRSGQPDPDSLPHLLVKAKSEQVLPLSTAVPDSALNVVKAKSLELLSGMAMWESEVVTVELYKGERGLGFSILDYQVHITFTCVFVVFSFVNVCYFSICLSPSFLLNN